MRTAIFVFVTALVFPSAVTWADDAPEGWQFVGVTQASRSVTVQPQVTGYVTRVAVREGDVVVKGDLLLEIDSRPYQLDLEAARARMKEAEARLRLASIESAKATALLERNVITPEAAELKMAATAEAEAALELSQVEVQQAELTLSWTRLTAPISGTVSRFRVSEGGLVTADQTQILTVVSTERMQICFNVPETILLHLRRKGAAAPGQLDVAIGYADEDGFPHEADETLIDPEVNSQTGSVRFRSDVSNADSILSPGMSARVHLSAAPR